MTGEDEERDMHEELEKLLASFPDGKYYQIALFDNRCPHDVVCDLVKIGSKVAKRYGFSTLSCMADLQKKIVKMTIGWINEDPKT